MYMQDKGLVFEVVPGGTLREDVRTPRPLASVAGLLVHSDPRNGATCLCIRYNEEFTELIRNRKEGRPRKAPEV